MEAERVFETQQTIKTTHEVLVRETPILHNKNELEEELERFFEIGDVQINLMALAEEVGVDVTKARDRKMQCNHERPKSYYDEKQKKKMADTIL